MSLQLFQGDLSPFAARVRIQIRAKGINDVTMTGAPGGTGSEEYRQLNPTGKIPALLVDGVVIAESQTICDYLEDRYPEPSMWPRDPLVRAQARLITRYTDLYVCGPMFQTTAHASRKTRDQAFVDARLVELQKGLTYIDHCRAKSGLATGRYAIGESLTLADAALAPALFFVTNFVATVFARDDLMTAGMTTYWEGIQSDQHVSPVIAEMAAALAAVRAR
jgi:glutathione S-transferase